MADDFASALAERIQSHKEFWTDLSELQVAGVRSSVLNASSLAPGEAEDLGRRFGRLLYSASVFAQTANEDNQALAQTIALSALLVSPDDNMRERTESILAQIGNFPALHFLGEQREERSSSFLSRLQVRLLRAVNSITVGNTERALTDFQFGVWGALQNAQTMSISAPTSAGKSFVIIEYLCRKVQSGAGITAVYIAPTRALLAEVHRKLSDRLADSEHTRVSTVPALDAEHRPKQIFVLTQERLQVLLSVAKLNVDLVIVDEAQNLADGARGMILQDCLERIRLVNGNVQMFLLAPGAEGFEDVAGVLGVSRIEEKETNLSPVLQNRILVKTIEGDPKRFSLSLLTAQGVVDIGQIPTERGVADPATRLAVAALELGKQGAALVYARGPAEAEGIASQLATDMPASSSPTLADLAQFIRQHIHPRYGLGAMASHGVAFHYGRMPTLLRDALEVCFRSGHIRYLVCTTTLFQGVNLPARSVFINTPTRGKGAALDPAQLWNFAGRAGRLGQDLVGNVFLVDYHKWKDQPLDKRVKFRVQSALSRTLRDHFELVVDAVNGKMPKLNPRDSVPGEVRAAAGLLLARASSDRGTALMKRLTVLTGEQRKALEAAASEAAHGLGLPTSLLENNWTVDPYGLQRLASRMREKITDGAIDDLIPLHPREADAYQRYVSIFNRAAREVWQYKAGAFGSFVANYAVPWMRGVPYPILLGRWIKYHQEKNPKKPVNTLVREAFDFIEDMLRFRMVQLGKAYLDVLHYVFEETGLGARRREIFDYALALELGVSSTSGRAFIELGTSRITAIALEGLFPDSEMTPNQARARLQKLNVEAVSLSPVIVAELRSLHLVPEPAG